MYSFTKVTKKGTVCLYKSVVEPDRRESGDRPCASHGAATVGQCVPPYYRGDDRREDSGAPEKEEKSV